jgi:hypothetical protein
MLNVKMLRDLIDDLDDDVQICIRTSDGGKEPSYFPCPLSDTAHYEPTKKVLELDRSYKN